MTTTMIVTLAVTAGTAIGFTARSLLNRTVGKPEGEVAKVAYGDKILLHMHPEKVLPYLPAVQDEQIAYLFGMTLQEYRSAKKVYDDQAKQAAAELLHDPSFRAKVAQLPFKKDQTILVLGESTADALNSWVVILKYLLEMGRPQENVQVINAAISGQTTTEALRRITKQVKSSPDWVLCHLGANDCMRYGGESRKPTVSLTETMANLSTIREIVAAQTKANFVWMAPAPVHEKKIASFPPFKSIELSLSNAEILAVGDSLRSKPELVVDMRDDFSVPAKPEYVQFDGGHLTVAGQTVIVKALIDRLTHGQ